MACTAFVFAAATKANADTLGKANYDPLCVSYIRASNVFFTIGYCDVSLHPPSLCSSLAKRGSMLIVSLYYRPLVLLLLPLRTLSHTPLLPPLLRHHRTALPSPRRRV